MSAPSLTLDQISALSAEGLTTEQIVRVVSILFPKGLPSDILAKRREKDRARKALSRKKPDQREPEVAAENPQPSTNLSADIVVAAEVRSPTPSKNNITPLFQKDSGKEDSRIQHAREDRFDEFWRAYPKREGNNPRKPASERFGRAVAKGADPTEIISGAHRYAEHLKATGKDGSQFVQQAVTWLNQEGWKNEYQQGKNGHDRFGFMGAAERARASLNGGNRHDDPRGGSSDGLFDRADPDLDVPGDYIEH